MDNAIDIRIYLNVILRRWPVILGISISIVIIAFMLSIMQKPVYEAKATILIRNESSSALSQYAGLAGMLGVNFGKGNIGDLMELLKSRAVSEKVLDDLKLVEKIQGWNNPQISRNDMISVVNGMVKPPRSVGNLLEIKAEYSDPQLTADIANAYVNALSLYWNKMNYTEAQKKLAYIESELPRVEKDLKSAEKKLKLAPRSLTGISFGTQVGISGPQRDYEIYSTVYIMLRKELESTKLEASKEIPPFSILDPAEKPLVKSRPKTKMDVMMGLFFGLFAGAFTAYFLEYWEKSGNKQ